MDDLSLEPQTTTVPSDVSFTAAITWVTSSASVITVRAMVMRWWNNATPTRRRRPQRPWKSLGHHFYRLVDKNHHVLIVRFLIIQKELPFKIKKNGGWLLGLGIEQMPGNISIVRHTSSASFHSSASDLSVWWFDKGHVLLKGKTMWKWSSLPKPHFAQTVRFWDHNTTFPSKIMEIDGSGKSSHNKVASFNATQLNNSVLHCSSETLLHVFLNLDLHNL